MLIGQEPRRITGTGKGPADHLLGLPRSLHLSAHRVNTTRCKVEHSCPDNSAGELRTAPVQRTAYPHLKLIGVTQSVETCAASPTKMSEATGKNENLSAFGKAEAKHHTPEYYKDLSEAGKRRERKKRLKRGCNAKTLHASVENENITSETTLTPIPSREQTTASSSKNEPRQQHSKQDHTFVPQGNLTGVPLTVQPSTRLRGNSKQTPNRQVLGDPDIALEPKTPVTICPPPAHYKLLSGPGKRRDRRSRQKQAASCIARQEDASEVKEPPISTIDTGRQCHFGLEIFDCGHTQQVMCYACSSRKRPNCDLHFMRQANMWRPDDFIRFMDEPCTRCPPEARRSAQNRRFNLLTHESYIRSWYEHSDRNCGGLTVEKLLFREADYLHMNDESGTWQEYYRLRDKVWKGYLNPFE
jgi:hypothetical protein